MEPRSIWIAAALAALAAVPPYALAQSEALQSSRRDPWTLPSERGSRADNPGQALRRLSPDNAPGTELGWLRSSDYKPGSGLQLGIVQGWALYADWDRYRPRTPVRDAVDTLLLGVQYEFR